MLVVFQLGCIRVQWCLSVILSCSHLLQWGVAHHFHRGVVRLRLSCSCTCLAQMHLASRATTFIVHFDAHRLWLAIIIIVIVVYACRWLLVTVWRGRYVVLVAVDQLLLLIVRWARERSCKDTTSTRYVIVLDATMCQLPSELRDLVFKLGNFFWLDVLADVVLDFLGVLSKY